MQREFKCYKKIIITYNICTIPDTGKFYVKRIRLSDKKFFLRNFYI